VKEKRYAQSKVELAKILGVTRLIVQRASKMDGFPQPIANGSWPVEACRAFIEANTNVISSTSGLGEVKLEIANQDARLKKIKADELEGKLTNTEELAREAGPTLSAFKDLLYQKLGNEIPIAMAGVDVPQARIIGTRFADELLASLQITFRKWAV
jgi:hypothetical protein